MVTKQACPEIMETRRDNNDSGALLIFVHTEVLSLNSVHSAFQWPKPQRHYIIYWIMVGDSIHWPYNLNYLTHSSWSVVVETDHK